MASNSSTVSTRYKGVTALQLGARQRAAAATFDNSRLVDFSEQVQYDAPAAQLTPLVREGGRLVVTDQRVYFQPLHNVTGGTPVLSHPLAAVAAVAHRSSSLRPVGKAIVWLVPLLASSMGSADALSGGDRSEGEG